MRRCAMIVLALLGCSEAHNFETDAGERADAGRPRDIQDGGRLERDGRAPPDAADADVVELDGGAVDGGAFDGGEFDAGLVDGVLCAGAVCDGEREGCLASCVEEGTRTPTCVGLRDGMWPEECPSGDEQFPRLWLRCDGPEDCPSVESCLYFPGSVGSYAYCSDSGFGDPLCHGDPDCPPSAPRCVPSVDLIEYSVCTSG